MDPRCLLVPSSLWALLLMPFDHKSIRWLHVCWYLDSLSIGIVNYPPSGELTFKDRFGTSIIDGMILICWKCAVLPGCKGVKGRGLSYFGLKELSRMSLFENGAPLLWTDSRHTPGGTSPLRAATELCEHQSPRLTHSTVIQKSLTTDCD